jgi:hypothetical protein
MDIFDALEDLDEPKSLSLYDYASVQPSMLGIESAQENERKTELGELIVYYQQMLSGEIEK